MSFSGKEYSFLAVSMCKTTEERIRDERKLSRSTPTLAKKMAKKIASILRSRSWSSRRQSTLVFNYSTYSDREESQCKYFTSESQRFCPDISTSRRSTSFA
ncbi:hypothetical protein KC19_1G212000 [Ceratodon purpureus]|uniref:Uncharacterized protein n=1 Tax=Ceratodon purpureus TaxID=3225 RepID=A0A8T0J7N5_CERPU|nr:hypothetical protein KC19_1G212000 [Ceratodon purpureus]